MQSNCLFVLALALLAPAAAFRPPAPLPRRLRSRSSAAPVMQVFHPRAAPCLDVPSLQVTVDEAEAMQRGDWKKDISLIGSTGSIGTQTLDIVRAKPELFSVSALAAGGNVGLLAQQVSDFRHSVKTVSVGSADLIQPLKDELSNLGVPLTGLEICAGAEGLNAVATQAEADVVVTGIVGCAGLLPTVEAIKAGKDIALANKETLIAGGPYILPLLKKYGVNLTPADSEHSAIFQCLQGVPPNAMRKIILTASGGAFRDYEADELLRLCRDDPEFVRSKATTHPNWDMGAKITVDSATMFNKGLEVIEAHYLFGADYDDIEVVIHPQSIIHSAVETQDGSVIAQMGWPDMRLPILYSVAWPQRVPMPQAMWESPLDLVKLGQMTFKAPDHAKYPGIELAFAAGRRGGTMTGALNAANEMANEIFRGGNPNVGFMDIPRLVEATMARHERDFTQNPSLDDILAVDSWARKTVTELASEPAPQLIDMAAAR